MSARRGQVLPIAAGVLTLTVIVFTFFVNVAGYQTTASIAIDSAARSAGLAALTEVDTTKDFTRWYIDPVAAASTAREYAALTIMGESSASFGTGSLANLFTTEVGEQLADVLARSADPDNDGTASRDGIDIEVINPAMNGLDPTSYRFLNGVANGSDGGSPDIMCSAEPGYPESVTSVLDGNCYSSTTVVLRIRLSARQTGGGSTTLTRTIAVSYGTNS